MSTQYRLVQSGKTASGGCSASPRFVRAVAPRIYLFNFLFIYLSALLDSNMKLALFHNVKFTEVSINLLKPKLV
jgi:hypothetical protein